MSPADPPQGPVVLMLPVYDDWPALALLIGRIDAALAEAERRVDVLAIDDGSRRRAGPDLLAEAGELRSIRSVSVLGLRRNLGHQRAIAVGLAWLERRGEHGAVVVMDADGEDDPADVPRLLAACAEHDWHPVVFAERTRRSESPLFISLYHTYRLLHVLLTGRGVRVGNFSVVPRRHLPSLSVTGELWNHYAAAVFRSRLPTRLVPTRRARRLSGQGTMNLTSLVVHGLSALSVWGDVIGVRLFIAASTLIVLATVALIGVVATRLFTDLAVPGWATAAAGLAVVVLLQALTFAALFILTILGGRQAPSFLPRRDHKHYVAGLRRLYPPSDNTSEATPADD